MSGGRAGGHTLTEDLFTDDNSRGKKSCSFLKVWQVQYFPCSGGRFHTYAHMGSPKGLCGLKKCRHKNYWEFISQSSLTRWTDRMTVYIKRGSG